MYIQLLHMFRIWHQVSFEEINNVEFRVLFHLYRFH